jgi:hypothetical protein
MLTSPSTSPSHPTTRPLSPPFPHSPPSRSLTRALRFSHNGISHNPAKPSDHWNAGARSTRTFSSMGPNLRSSTKGKEREAFDSLDSGPFREYSLSLPRVFATARLPIGTYLRDM